MTVTVRAVKGPTDLDAFLQVPFALYRDDPHWIAPLFLERREHLSRKKNPYFKHAEAELFVAWRGAEPVGRISAQIDRLRLERHRDSTGQFGFIEAPDDGEVFQALIAAAEAWLKGRSMTRIQGPFSFSINDETGLLIDGFDTPPAMLMGHARPYYNARVLDLGFTKAKDVIAYDYNGLTPLAPAMAAMMLKAKNSGELVLRSFSKKHLARDLAIIVDIFNDAWSGNWGFVPWTQEEIDVLGKNLKLLIADQYIAIAEHRGEPVAMAVTLPDLNGWISDLNGRLMPFGWAKLAWRLFTGVPQAVRMPLMGVKRKYHSTPFGAALALGVIDQLRAYHLARGTRRAELSWILEDNRPMRRMIEALGATAYKTYRVYEKPIA